MRLKKDEPWLSPDGVEIPTAQLKTICKKWNRKTWEAYLKWYESSCRELLIEPGLYDDICDRRTQSVFQEFDQNTDFKNSQLCEQLLAQIPTAEKSVLEHIFLHGRTEREIAAIEGRSKSGIHKLKDRALSRLKRGIQGNEVGTRHLMRGGDSKNATPFWDRPLKYKIRESRAYDPTKHKDELENHIWPSMREAMRKLSDRQQRMIYLRFWYDYSFSDIARELNCGVNVVDQILDATIVKIKRSIMTIELGYEPGGGPSCA